MIYLHTTKQIFGLGNLGLYSGEIFLSCRHGLLEADDLGYSVDHFLNELHLLS